MTIEEKLAQKGLTMPNAQEPVGNYLPVVIHGQLAYVSGHGSVLSGYKEYRGKVGKDHNPEAGYEAAQVCLLNCLASLRAALGDLNRVKRIIKLTGYVNSAEGFVKQPLVLNGASDLLVFLFGDRGKHGRTAIALNQVANDYTVQLEMIVEINS